MNYKDTLLIGKTDFSMKAGLPTNEPIYQQNWQENNIYAKVQNKNKEKPLFILHDGPPYANGSIHIGHAMNKILKDFVVRYKNLNNYKADYVMGWDTHGLPIEQALTQSGIDRSKFSDSEFRELCLKYATEQIEIQKNQFKRLGIFTNYEKYYVTFDKEYEAEQIRVFNKMMQKGLIYKGEKPVYWSPTSESALAEAEIEYQDTRSPSVYVKFPLSDGRNILIWTTTPWTLPANRAVAVGSNILYVEINYNNEIYIVAEDLYEKLITKFEWTDAKKVKSIYGKELIGQKVEHPIFKTMVPIVSGHHVTTSDGTGIVHIAPGHGEDDFIIGQENNLKIVSIVNETGHMNEAAQQFAGLFYADANKAIGEFLEKQQKLIKLEFVKHSYPHDWRTKKPIIFRSTPQWFASIDKIRNQLLNEIENVNWINAWGEKRLYNMIESRHDWCISRQRLWGVPIPIFYNEAGEPITDEKLINHVADLFSKHGSNIWFEIRDNQELLKDFTNQELVQTIADREYDIMDVWFDSGSSHSAANFEKRFDENQKIINQADLYLEGSDQYRGWFNSSLITGYATNGYAPYKTVLSHGFALDGKGNKMSKSIGNTVDPLKVCDQYGSDILRLWVATSDYQADVRISDDLLKQTGDLYRKLRNTFRFMLSNIEDYDHEQFKNQYHDLNNVDLYMMLKLKQLNLEIEKAYDNYQFKKVVDLINNYFVRDLSNFYLNFAKDILYIEEKNNTTRRHTQMVIYAHINYFMKILAPIIPHTADEICQFFKKEAIMLQELAENKIFLKQFDNSQITKRYDLFKILFDDINREIEILRENKIINKNYEVEITINTDGEQYEALKAIGCENLALYLMVSKVNLNKNEFKVIAKKSGDLKCERCLKYWPDLIDNTLCKRCSSVIEQMGVKNV